MQKLTSSDEHVTRTVVELRSKIEASNVSIATLQEEVEQTKRMERDLIPVLSSLFVEKLEKMAANGEEPSSEEGNIRSWLQEHSQKEQHGQERGDKQWAEHKADEEQSMDIVQTLTG